MSVKYHTMFGRRVGQMVGIFLTIVCLAAFFRQIELDKIFGALVSFDFIYLLFGIISLGAGYAARILRWSIMLSSTGADVGFRSCSAPFLGSIALNNVLPFRIGDIVRALVFPATMGISKTTATSSLIVERLIDLLALLICFAIGLFSVSGIQIHDDLKSSAITFASIGFLVLIIVFFFSDALATFFSNKGKKAKSENFVKLYNTIRDLLLGFNCMSRLHVLLSMIAISAIIWIAEAGLFYFILKGMHFQSFPIEGLLVMSVATLSTLLPSSPGYVGTFHVAVLTAILLIGGTSAQASTYAIIVHMALWIPTTLAGAFAMWRYPELFRVARARSETI